MVPHASSPRRQRQEVSEFRITLSKLETNLSFVKLVLKMQNKQRKYPKEALVCCDYLPSCCFITSVFTEIYSFPV